MKYPLYRAVGLGLLLTVKITAGVAEVQQGVDPHDEDYQAIEKRYAEHCSVCHGERLEGAAQGVALVGRELTHGDSIAQLQRLIAEGVADKGMPAWGATLPPELVRSLAILISEKRTGFDTHAFRVNEPMVIPEGTVHSDRHDFLVEVVADDIDPLPSAIALLPNGEMLLTEKYRGLSIISETGERRAIGGTPSLAARDENTVIFKDLDQSNGWMLGVALHPDYSTNGWIYLAFGDLCEDCQRADPANRATPSMTKLLRGRIRDNAWVDEESIWEARKSDYNQQSDMISGGIVSFDNDNHVYMVVGCKNVNDGVQELDKPYGKIHRVHDDGRIPDDNPFVNVPGAVQSIWSYGHRNPLGLVYDRRSGNLWSSENGPRGGDEVNLILPGRNYGWPLYSLGVNYDGTEVNDGPRLGIEWKMEDIEQPVVDFTPSPAVSALDIYQGTQFPGWENNLIVGSLRARTLYRVELDGTRFVRREALLEGIGRIRDVKTDASGSIYLLVEHPDGGKILRLRVADPRVAGFPPDSSIPK